LKTSSVHFSVAGDSQLLLKKEVSFLLHSEEEMDGRIELNRPKRGREGKLELERFPSRIPLHYYLLQLKEPSHYTTHAFLGLMSFSLLIVVTTAGFLDIKIQQMNEE
jgi:hypothetical protein